MRFQQSCVFEVRKAKRKKKGNLDLYVLVHHEPEIVTIDSQITKA